MSNFGKCFDILMDHEIPPNGDPFEDVPGDEGGPTKYGITLKAWMDYCLNIGVPHEYDFLAGLKDVTIRDARAFYLSEFWDLYRYGEIDSTAVAARIFLATVNLGPARSHYAAQRACRACGHPIKEDGVIGPTSFETLNTILPAILLPALGSEVAAYYRRILDKAAWETKAAGLAGLTKSPKEKFRAGWMRRAYSNAPA